MVEYVELPALKSINQYGVTERRIASYVYTARRGRITTYLPVIVWLILPILAVDPGFRALGKRNDMVISMEIIRVIAGYIGVFYRRFSFRLPGKHCGTGDPAVEQQPRDKQYETDQFCPKGLRA